jgi:fructan beta-fructosidase
MKIIMHHTTPGTVARLALLLCASALHAAELYHEPWRPQFHFTSATNWMNDPNGMVFFDGEYHLFYQCNPFGDKWGHMSWGHAVSQDLVRWEHLPIALYEENEVMIFSGSAVVDWTNTSGFGKDGQPPMVAIYTGHYTKKPIQNQHVAYSNDRGRTWTKFAGNPVLDIGEKDFRDPKVMWHESTKRWVMTLAWPLHRTVRFYSSTNLREWTHLSDFGPAGSTTGIWECPDLFPLRVEGQPGLEKWALIVNVGSGAPAGGSGCQYFVGDFDGKQFTLDASFPASKDAALWADWGRDFYAAVSWSDIPKSDGRRLWLGWMSNWEYANDVPTSPWRSAMSVPRELTFRRTSSGLRLVQRPVAEMLKLREGAPRRFSGGTLAAAASWLHEQQHLPPLLDIELTFTGVTTKSSCTLHFHTSPDEATTLTLDGERARMTVDRTRSGKTDFHPKFPGRDEAPLRIAEGGVTLRLLVDTSSIEVFAQSGEIVLTKLIFPSVGPRRLSLTGDREVPGVGGIIIHGLKSSVLLR